ncbi:MAG: hypothetical protein M0036_07965 [Desulfobacteraceae bacterium]|nr:hypothetical protein [Desulfobacteraceae bacterium]
MSRSICLKEVMLIAVIILFGLSNLAVAGEAQQIDSCSLLTKDEIKAAFGQEVTDGKANTAANPMVGAPCQYKIGSYGSFSILIKPAAPGETADNVKAELQKRKIPVSKAADIGDRSFFSSPGYGMVQLNTFKGSHYLIITTLVMGATEAAQQTACEKLMRTALTKIK